MFSRSQYPSHGVDLSRYNGAGIWDTLDDLNDGPSSDNPLKFAVIKCSHYTSEFGFLVDPLCDFHASEAIARQWLVGYYHFIDSRTDAAAQADFFASELKARPRNLRPVIDFEPIEFEDKETKKMVRISTPAPSQLVAMVRRLQTEHGINPAIYCGQSYVEEFDSKEYETVFSECPVWLAAYRGKLDKVGMPTLPPLVPRIVSPDAIAGYQFTRGREAGYPSLDRNLFRLEQWIDIYSPPSTMPDVFGGDMHETTRAILDREAAALRKARIDREDDSQ